MKNQNKYCTSEILIRKKTLHFHCSVISFLVIFQLGTAVSICVLSLPSMNLKQVCWRMRIYEYKSFFFLYILLVFILLNHDHVLEEDVCRVYWTRPSAYTANFFGWIGDQGSSRSVQRVPHGGCVYERPVLYCGGCYNTNSFSIEAKKPSSQPAVPARTLDLCSLKSCHWGWIAWGVKGGVTNRKGVQ